MKPVPVMVKTDPGGPDVGESVSCGVPTARVLMSGLAINTEMTRARQRITIVRVCLECLSIFPPNFL